MLCAYTVSLMQQVCRWQDDDCRLDVVVIDGTWWHGGRPADDGVDAAAAADGADGGGIHHGRRGYSVTSRRSFRDVD